MAGGDQNRREGRGRLSNIDLLPEEADAAVACANEQLRAHDLPQTVIFAEFNEKLADVGLEPISKSSFSRYAVRKAIQFRRHDEARRMSAELVSQLGPDGADEVTVMVAELLKVVLLEQLEGGELKPKEAMELGRALQSVVSAQKTSTEHRKKLEQESAARVAEAFDEAEKAVSEAGLSADRIAQLRREFLGVKAPA